MAGILQNTYTLLNPKTHPFPFIKPFNFRPISSQQTHNNNNNNVEELKITRVDDVPKKQKKKRKLRPSFNEQIRDKWSIKPVPNTTKLPWQLPHNLPHLLARFQDKVVDGSKFEEPVFDSRRNAEDNVSDGSPLEEPGFDSRRYVDEKSSMKSVIHGRKVEEPVFDYETRVIHERKIEEPVFDYERIVDTKLSMKSVMASCDEKNELIGGTPFDDSDDDFSGDESDFDIGEESGEESDFEIVEESGEFGSNVACEEVIQFGGDAVEVVIKGRVEKDRRPLSEGKNDEENSEKDRLPWMPETDGKEANGERRRRSKAELAEKSIPEYELNRLRNVALRMKERMKVGAAGVTQAVVDGIHEKWKLDEVVKVKFEGPPTINMRRTHEILENKTGGLVIWRSGSSVVLYRGLTYKFNCVNTYMKEKRVNSDDLPDPENSLPDFVGLQKNTSPEELTEMNDFDKLLDGLGPRFIDWSGRPPIPVDADLLPGFVLEYKTPFRLLPHGVLRRLKDSEVTKFRREARLMPPHFALGRNRELQGLASAMVKLWEKSALAKIAIKRGVLNTRNERMAEELKRLTGGTLLSRNKEFIVFYRGNDFMPPLVTESLRERETLTTLQFEEEETRRYGSTLINSNAKKSKAPLVAGTLAETIAATSRWAKPQDSKDIDKMLRDSALARRASLVRYLQKKQAIAYGKLRKAENALEKVQKYLKPEELPTDLEIITDEERLVFRKMGLSMKPYLLLGRREVFSGTIQNMHLHWKFRELVKIVVKGKNFAQVKHIAISLEAESGGVLVSMDKSMKGYDIIFYRGKNYRRPDQIKPKNLLTRRQALARSIELQRREGLKHHISSLREQMELAKSELEDLKAGRELDEKTFYEKLDDSSILSDDEMEEDEDEEAYLLTYDSSDERGVI